MRILFWGTPEFALPSLGALSGEGHVIAAVVTQPDRPAGRGRKLRASPVAEMAAAEGWEVLKPERPSGSPFLERIQALDAEISVVVAYGHILGRDVLDIPRLGSINVHASLLPRLRGAAPVNWAIARGHTRTGVTVMRMVEEMDAGPILFQTEEPIGPDETASDLSMRLSEVGAEALIEALALMEAGVLEEREQDHAKATFAPKVGRQVARIDWSEGAQEIANHVRGMDAVPGAWTELDERPIKMFRPEPDDQESEEPAGTVVSADANSGLVVATGNGMLGIGEVQPSGRRRMSAVAWIQGRHVEAGQRFR